MRVISTFVALVTAQLATAQYSGFNYGSTFTTGAAKQQADFEAEFKQAAGLTGAPVGFNSARLYTMVQAGTTNDPISAIPAGISTRTSLLFGLWASAGDAAFANELTALRRAIEQYGGSLGGLVAGISVGSEDLYRNSPTGKLNNENPGAEPSKIVDYIRQVREAIAGTPLSGVPVGHVDTWTEWVNLDRNRAVVQACDWIGFDGYPYFETTAAQGNSIDQNKALFDSALAATNAAAAGKPVWITETGFPVSGKTSGQAVPSVENARRYWEQVACSILGKTNVWWYTAKDASPQTPNPSFGIIGSDGRQIYDLSCTNVQTPPPPSSSSSAGSTSPPSTSSRSGGDGGGNSGGGSGTASSSTSLSTISAPTTSPGIIGGGSPGAGSGPGSSQLSIQTQTTSTGGPVPTGPSTTSGTGSDSGGNGTMSILPIPTSSTTLAPGSGAIVKSGSIGAAFAAIIGAILVI